MENKCVAVIFAIVYLLVWVWSHLPQNLHLFFHTKNTTTQRNVDDKDTKTANKTDTEIYRMIYKTKTKSEYLQNLMEI